jgi:hypothetical protein
VKQHNDDGREEAHQQTARTDAGRRIVIVFRMARHRGSSVVSSRRVERGELLIPAANDKHTQVGIVGRQGEGR